MRGDELRDSVDVDLSRRGSEGEGVRIPVGVEKWVRKRSFDKRM